MEKVKLAAKALMTARERDQPLVDFPDESAPKSIAEAFAIQDEILISRDTEIVAWKVGPSSKEFPPTCAAIARENLYASPAQLSKSLRLKAVECEVAFRLAVDLPADRGPYNATQAKAAISTAMVAIEAVETRYHQWPVKDPIWALADSQSNEALIVGGEIGLDKLEHFPDFHASLTIGEKVKAADRGFPGGDPFALIAWLAGHLSERYPLLSKRGLKKGDIITTGSWNGVDFANSQEKISAVFEGLGHAELEYS